MARGTVDVVEGMKCVTLSVRVTRVRELTARLRLAVWLMRLAARVANMNIEIKDR